MDMYPRPKTDSKPSRKKSRYMGRIRKTSPNGRLLIGFTTLKGFDIPSYAGRLGCKACAHPVGLFSLTQRTLGILPSGKLT